MRAEKDQITKVKLLIPENFNQIQSQSMNGSYNPVTLADVNCYALLTTGPEDYLHDSYCRYASNGNSFPVGRFDGGFLSAAGGTTISIDIPSGKDRAFKLVGFKVPNNFDQAAVCAGFKGNNAYQSMISEPFVIGEATGLDMPAGETKDVNITAAFSASNKLGDCKGPDFFEGSRGPPAKIGITFQDLVGTFGKPLSPDNCVGVRFQLQDINGNRADLSGNPLITTTLKTLVLGNTIGNLYRLPSTNAGACASADLESGASGDISISFINNGVASSDRLYFFQVASTTPSYILQVIQTPLSATSISGDFTFAFTSSTPTKTTYAFYDLYNHRSTATITASNPAQIRSNECRPAVVQFLDANSVPMMSNAVLSPKQIIVNDSLSSASDLQFYDSGANCTNSISGDHTLTINPANNQPLGSTKLFYYRTGGTVSNSVSFSVTNGVSGAPVIPSGDITFGSNVFNIYNN